MGPLRKFAGAVLFLCDYLDLGGSRKERERIMRSWEESKHWTDGTE